MPAEPGTTVEGERWLYVGSQAGKGATGSAITLLHHDVSTTPTGGRLQLVGAVARSPSPTFLAWHPNQRHLYAVDTVPEATVTAYEVDDAGRLRDIGIEPTGGSGACHVAVHPSGRFLVVANYGSGSLSLHPIATDGSVGRRSDIVHHHGRGLHARRQSGPHVHQTQIDPAGEFIVACDLGLDAIVTYTLDPDTGRLDQHSIATTEPGAGPRHLVFSQSGQARVVHVVGELNSTVASFEYESGKLLPLGVVPSSVSPVPEQNLPSALAISDDGHFLYVANRGLDVITTFAIDGSDLLDASKLRPIADVPSGGSFPRHIAVAGTHLYVANQKSDQVTLFDLDPTTGLPQPTGQTVTVANPTCVAPALKQTRSAQQ
jgi:6-phosphogluconolactonase